MSSPVSQRILWLAALAGAVFIALSPAASSALAQGKPDQPQQTRPGRDAPRSPYPLIGDASNFGASTTVFSTTNGSSSFFGWDFVDTKPGDTTLHGSGARIGVRGDGTNYGVYGSSAGTAGVYGFSSNAHGVFGESNGTNTGTAGVFGYSSSSIGVRGQSPSGIGVSGSSASGIGVSGTSTDSFGISGESVFGNGVHGKSSSDNGVFGESDSNIASGVYGENLSGGIGVAGRNNSTDSNMPAVLGNATGNGGTGVYGTSNFGVGVRALSYSDDALSAQTSAVGKAGVLGFNDTSSGAGYGVRGYVTSSNAGSYGGYFSATEGIGVSGRSNNGRGVHGESGSSFGVYAKSTSGIGLYGFSSSNIGLYGQTSTGNYALYAVNPSKAPSKYAGFFEGNVRINGNYVATGTKSALVYTNQGDRLMYAEEATRNYFSDQGAATLKDGRARIKIDPLFAQTVSLNEGYMVILTPGSFDSRGLAFGNATATSFEVRELSGGKGNYSFVWRITALRRGYEKLRMELAPPAPAPLDDPAGLKDTSDK